jgi:hypothetical protein
VTEPPIDNQTIVSEYDDLTSIAPPGPVVHEQVGVRRYQVHAACGALVFRGEVVGETNCPECLAA